MKKKEGISRVARHFFTFLKRAIPKTLFASTCMETNRVAQVRHHPFDLDTIESPGK
jgi:hypothetical protein